MGACARNMQSDPAEIKPAQCCIKLVFSFDLYYDARKHKIKTIDMLFTFSNICIFPRFQSTHQLPLYYSCNVLAVLQIYMKLMSLQCLDLASYKEESYEVYLYKFYFVKIRFNFLVQFCRHRKYHLVISLYITCLIIK